MGLGALLQRFRPQTLVGCDIGGDCLKVVTLVRSGVSLQLAQQGMEFLSIRGDEDEIARQVKDFFHARQITTQTVAMNIADKSLQVRAMELAKMPARDLQMAIRWNMRESIEGPLEKYRVAFTRIGAAEGDRQKLMAYGLSAEAVQAASQRATKMGLTLSLLEPDVSALMAAADHNLYWKPGERIALVHIGFRHSLLLIASEGSLMYVRYMPGGALERLGHILERTGDAEQQRRAVQQLSELQREQPDHVGEALGKFYSELLLEIERSINAYVSEQGLAMGEGVNYLFLSGGGALLPNLSEYLVKNFGIGAEVFNPFRKIVDAAGQPVVLPDAPLYAVAVGLAIPTK